jgi:hypothetical protein
MAITVKHSKVSTIPDEADTSLVRPSDWNADHTLTGTIDIANGGTGQTTANAAFNALVPSQTGNTGKYLTTDGTDTSWATNPLGTVTSVDLTASTGISVSGGPITTSGSITVTNTAPDQTVVLNSGTGISTSGTYPNFTVTNTAPDQTVSIASGTGISATGTYPAFTVTNTAPDQVVALTGAGTTVVTGTYPNFTITSTDSTTGTVTSVAATAGTGISVTGSPITTSGTLNITNTAPDQTVVLNAGTGISTSGTYPNFTITNTSPSLGGDVVGPASATDNAVARFDTTTGKLIQNSTITLDDNGNLVNVNSVGFDTTPATVPTTVGTMSWDDGDGVPIVALKGGNVNLQVGTQEFARVYNDSGTTLTKGQAVYISGAQGNRVAVRLARANVEATSFGTIGLVAETMTSGAEGFIIVSGALYKLNTTGLTAGATVYLSPTTAGAVTTTKPQAPDQLVVIGWVERVDNIVGSIYVKIDNGYELDELHDVQITSPQSGNLLIYDATTTPVGVWKNANLTDGTGITITEGAGSVTIANAGVTALSAGTGISVSGSTGSVTVTNTAPDQTVSLTGAGTTSISGTYPNFTITSNDQYVGTVTSVSALTLGTTGTDLSSTVANGTTTPVITLNVPTASATNRGALSSADWTTFNNKAAPFTYTSTYIPFGQGTTTPNQSANLTFDGTTQTAPVQRASNGIVTNSKTIGTSFTIPSTDNAMSSGPVTLSAGVTVTVSSGSRWVVL